MKAKERTTARAKLLVQALQYRRMGMRTWHSHGAFLFEDEAETLFRHLQVRRYHDGERMYPDLRIIRAGVVLRIERDGQVQPIPPSIEERLTALEAAIREKQSS